MPRGDRFARGREPRRDAAGHSLPTDRSMRYVELQLVCKQHPVGEGPILGAWWIESHFEQFDPQQVNERANSAVERQRALNSLGRLRYKMRCPQCGNQPVFTGEKIDEALAALYEQDALAKVRQWFV